MNNNKSDNRLILYHNNMSACSQKVRIALAEKRLPFVGRHVNLGAGESHTAEYLKLNPNGVVPTLIDGTDVIIESTVICEYLEDAYPDAISLRPKLPAERAQMRVWTIVPDAGLHSWLSTLSFAIAWRHQDRSEQMKRSSARVRASRLELIERGLEADAVKPHFLATYGILKKMVLSLGHNPWLAGDAFSLADVAMMPYVARLDDLGQNWLWQEESELACIADWFERCQQRDGFVGISAYQESSFLDVMKLHGVEARDQLKVLIGYDSH